MTDPAPLVPVEIEATPCYRGVRPGTRYRVTLENFLDGEGTFVHLPQLSALALILVTVNDMHAPARPEQAYHVYPCRPDDDGAFVLIDAPMYLGAGIRDEPGTPERVRHHGTASITGLSALVTPGPAWWTRLAET